MEAKAIGLIFGGVVLGIGLGELVRLCRRKYLESAYSLPSDEVEYIEDDEVEWNCCLNKMPVCENEGNAIDPLE